MTLVELLIVIVILTTLVAAAIPVLSPTRDDRRLREAARGVNTYISGAQAKAISLHRPYGVSLKKLSQETGNPEDNGVCLEMFYVEQPPAFRGFDDTSAVRVALNTVIGGYPLNSVLIQFVARGTTTQRDVDGLPEGWDYELIPPMTIRPGDVVETGGSRYRLLENRSDLRLMVHNDGFYQPDAANPQLPIAAVPIEDSGQLRRPVVDNNGFEFSSVRDLLTGQKRAAYVDDVDAAHQFGDNAIAPYWTEPAPYVILRQPMPATAEPYQLPEGMAIDLRGSGITTNVADANPRGFFHRPEVQPPAALASDAINNENPVYIIFTPEGSIERLVVDQSNRLIGENVELFNEPVVSNVYLLIGRRENSPAPIIVTADPTLAPVPAGISEVELQELMKPINWLNVDSQWVVIGAQSGRVASADSAFVDLRNTQVLGPGMELQRRAWQIQTAREFARQMSQVGGR